MVRLNPLSWSQNGAPPNPFSYIRTSTLKELLQDLGMEASHFSGAATTAAGIGIWDSLIQQLGRMSSNAYRKYICPSEEEVGRMRADISVKPHQIMNRAPMQQPSIINLNMKLISSILCIRH